MDPRTRLSDRFLHSVPPSNTSREGSNFKAEINTLIPIHVYDDGVTGYGTTVPLARRRNKGVVVVDLELGRVSVSQRGC